MTGQEALAERLAEVLPCRARCYPATRNGAHSSGCVISRNEAAVALVPKEARVR